MRGFYVILFSLLVTVLVSMPASAGTITGIVKFAGKEIPAPKIIDINKDHEVCGRDVPSNVLLISKLNSGVRNAVVSIGDIKTDKKPQVSKDKLKFVQEKCGFHPRVFKIPAGAEIEIVNKDPLTHNIHTFGKDNATINQAQPKGTPSIMHSFDLPERIKVKCDIHKWMQGWFIVVDNPYTSLSQDDGSFSLKDVPPGTYKVSAWHEGLSSASQEVTIKGDEEVKIVFDLAAKKKRKRRKR